MSRFSFGAFGGVEAGVATSWPTRAPASGAPTLGCVVVAVVEPSSETRLAGVGEGVVAALGCGGVVWADGVAVAAGAGVGVGVGVGVGAGVGGAVAVGVAAAAGAGVGGGAGAGLGAGRGTGAGAAVKGGSSAGAFSSGGIGAGAERSIGARSIRRTVVGVSLRIGAGRSGSCKVGEGAWSASVGAAGRSGAASRAGAIGVGAAVIASPGVVSVVIAGAGWGEGAGAASGEGAGAGGGAGAGEGVGTRAGAGAGVVSVGVGGAGVGAGFGVGVGVGAAGGALRSAGASPVNSSPGCCRHWPWRAAPGAFRCSGVGGVSRTAPPERGCFASPTGPRSGSTTAGAPEPGS